MSGHLNVGGTWKELKSAYCNINGEWKKIKDGYANENGVWKKILSSGLPVYSIIYDKSLASDPAGCLTYTNACTGFTPMRNTSSYGDADEGSWAEGNGTIFDAIEVGCIRNGSWVTLQKHPATDYRNTYERYNWFTKIPKIYQKVTKLSDTRIQLDLSLAPFNGATLHPSFIMDGVEKNYLYIGRFPAYNSGSKMTSQLDYTCTRSVRRADFRVNASNNGAGYTMIKYFDWDLVNKLYLLAFKDFNGQTALGMGRVNESSVYRVGTTAISSWMYGGSTGGHWAMSFLGLESWWGNVSVFLDDVYSVDDVIYAGCNSVPTDDTANKIVIGNQLNSYGNYILTVRGGLYDFFLPETMGGSSVKGACDVNLFNSSVGTPRIMESGGMYSMGEKSGPFCLGDRYVTQASKTTSTRLVYRD